MSVVGSKASPVREPSSQIWPAFLKSDRFKSLLIFLGSLGLLLGLWEFAVQSGWFIKLMPPFSRVAVDFWAALTNPFYDNGENDKGIGWQLLASLRRVSLGFLGAMVVAVPLGFLIGLSRVASQAIDPFVQLLKPVSPLAWLPIGLALFKSSETTAIFVIFITSLWPMLLNTIFGVRSVNPVFLEVGRTLGASPWRIMHKIILPAAAPSIITGLRVSAGVAWLVIVAAEMLVGGTGVGYFVWNEWNNLNISNIIVTILFIGLIGSLIDRVFAWIEKNVTYQA
ncbi:nitrate ABC transporter permease [Anthocerotibacter panamensis]|uniref:nitrate ABC transporter permease n=1 Tax=Anthocerotibacter panamensis TaxID=2857077 RepID=UPI001C408167|nr:nitrate ABC transporter permease [Anthocerotibacter panamensis]